MRRQRFEQLSTNRYGSSPTISITLLYEPRNTTKAETCGKPASPVTGDFMALRKNPTDPLVLLSFDENGVSVARPVECR